MALTTEQINKLSSILSSLDDAVEAYRDMEVGKLSKVGIKPR